MADVTTKQVEAGVALPVKNDQDLRGFVPKPPLQKAPFVKDRQGVIWHWQDWMHDLGDVLEPCWEAPPQRAVQVPSLLDVQTYGHSLPTGSESTQKPDAPSPSVLTTPEKSAVAKKAKGGRPKGSTRAPRGDGHSQ
jgi:hypothetical protein